VAPCATITQPRQLEMSQDDSTATRPRMTSAVVNFL